MGGVGAMCYSLGHCRCVCHLCHSCCCRLHSLGGWGRGIVELLEVISMATGGGGRSGSVFLGLDGLFGFGEDGC